MLDPIHLLLDGLPQHRIVDHLKDKQRFRNLSKRLQRPIEGVLLRVRVEPAEQVRSRHFLELDGRDHAQDLIPLLNHNLVIGVASGLDLPGGAVYSLAVPCEACRPDRIPSLQKTRYRSSGRCVYPPFSWSDLQPQTESERRSWCTNRAVPWRTIVPFHRQLHVA